ncbi:MAG: hypothetical protein ACREUW_22580 [Burkholderiales bacterium]
MFRLIVVLILAGQGTFLTGIETPSGLVQKSFRNDEAGVDEFYAYGEQVTKTPGAPYAFCLIRHGSGDYGDIGITLVLGGQQPAVLGAADYAAFVEKTQADGNSAVTAAKACAAAFPQFATAVF